MTSSLMLDTNAASMAARGGYPNLDRRLASYGTDELCISTITEGEILFGLAKAPAATRLARVMKLMLSRLTILPWTSETASVYGRLRAEMRQGGRALTPLDMLIAAHALSIGAILVTNDKAFLHVPELHIEDWTA